MKLVLKIQNVEYNIRTAAVLLILKAKREIRLAELKVLYAKPITGIGWVLLKLPSAVKKTR